MPLGSLAAILKQGPGIDQQCLYELGLSFGFGERNFFVN